MKAEEAMKILGITRQQLYQWTKTGKVVAVKNEANGRYDYQKESVLSLAGRADSLRWVEMGRQLKAELDRIYETKTERFDLKSVTKADLERLYDYDKDTFMKVGGWFQIVSNEKWEKEHGTS